jgi:hypothetical protein
MQRVYGASASRLVVPTFGRTRPGKVVTRFTFGRSVLCKTWILSRQYSVSRLDNAEVDVMDFGKETSIHGRLAQNEAQIPSQSRSIH